MSSAVILDPYTIFSTAIDQSFNKVRIYQIGIKTFFLFLYIRQDLDSVFLKIGSGQSQPGSSTLAGALYLNQVKYSTRFHSFHFLVNHLLIGLYKAFDDTKEDINASDTLIASCNISTMYSVQCTVFIFFGKLAQKIAYLPLKPLVSKI